MLPSVEKYIRDIDERIRDMDLIAVDCSSHINYVMATHVILSSSGLIEIGVRSTLSEYGRVNGDSRIFEFIENRVRKEYSIGWDKIKKLLKQFDEDWYDKIRQKTEEKNIQAIGSLNVLRNKIAHGDTVEVGYYQAKDYYLLTVCFMRDFYEVVLNS